MPVKDSTSGLAVLRLLADGERHSGEQLAGALDVSRTAVWKQLRSLRQLGLEIDAIRGVGYRLRRPFELLDRTAILASLAAPTHRALDWLEVFPRVESTNSLLVSGPRPAAGRLRVGLAEIQTAGRGRRGRTWFAPLGGGLCLSVAWVFPSQPTDLPALGLAVGVAARRVLLALTGLPIRLKWPNDLLVDDRKLGGILVELSAGIHGPCFVVIGIGINVTRVPILPAGSDAWSGGTIDLATAANGDPPSRNRLAAALIDAFAGVLADYGRHGFAAYHAAFSEADYLLGRTVRVDGEDRPIDGVAAGVGPDGTLLLETEYGLRKIVAGEISVRTGT